jgi:hypothetical protein
MPTSWSVGDGFKAEETAALGSQGISTMHHSCSLVVLMALLAQK